jgi:hypothetical protein
MVDLWGGPAALTVEPRQPCPAVMLPVNDDDHIAVAVGVAGYIAGLDPAVAMLPAEIARSLVIGQQSPQALQRQALGLLGCLGGGCRSLLRQARSLEQPTVCSRPEPQTVHLKLSCRTGFMLASRSMFAPPVLLPHFKWLA